MSGHGSTENVKKDQRVKWTPADGLKRERKWWFSIPVTAWVLGAFFGVSVITELLINYGPLVTLLKNLSQDVSTTIIAAMVYVLLLAVTLGVPRLLKLWSSRISYRRLLGLTRLLQWRDILTAVVGFIVYLALGVGLVLAISALVPGFNPQQEQNTGFSKVLAPNTAILVFLSLVVVAPLAEEIIFRGYLFGTLRRTVPVWVAALITSALFGFIHGQWNVGLDVFMMSLVSCFLRYRTGSLWASILLHMAKNGLAFYTLYIASNGIL